MADVAIENTESSPLVEKEATEEIDSVKKTDAVTVDLVTENGNEENGKKNGDGEKLDDVADEEESTNGNKKDDEDEEDDEEEDDEEEEEVNGDSTDAPAEAVKRKVGDAGTKTDEASPEKKAKLDESKEVESNGAESTEVVA